MKFLCVFVAFAICLAVSWAAISEPAAALPEDPEQDTAAIAEKKTEKRGIYSFGFDGYGHGYGGYGGYSGYGGYGHGYYAHNSYGYGSPYGSFGYAPYGGHHGFYPHHGHAHYSYY
ncbi:keratin-associated protein 19-2 [Drosophila miranda]|uniref:keratin-associated protein 19-2 n=1 Tax=Drosophila miranda TaxID=7229 RepID=UPI0007E8597B|nr:keratin-associated protein 19-2 [Drosophila miranda]